MEAPFTVYVPISRVDRVTLTGLDVQPGTFDRLADGLRAIAPDYIRSGLGHYQNPYQTLYQDYLAGGWAAVDARLLPFLADVADVGAAPLIEFMYGGDCEAPTLAELNGYADFVADAVERYDLSAFEVWNEPDAPTGLASLYGCFGWQHADRLVYLADRVRSQIDPARRMGVSFMANSAQLAGMIGQTAHAFDWIGVHHYAYYAPGGNLEQWPGGVAAKLYYARANSPVPVWLTEVNLLDSSLVCSPAFQQAQADYIADAFEHGAPMVSVLVYDDPPNWNCSGIYGTPADDYLRGYP